MQLDTEEYHLTGQVKRKYRDRWRKVTGEYKMSGHPSLVNSIHDIDTWTLLQSWVLGASTNRTGSVTFFLFPWDTQLSSVSWRLYSLLKEEWNKVKSATVDRVLTLELIINETHYSKCKRGGCWTCEIVRRSAEQRGSSMSISFPPTPPPTSLSSSEDRKHF